MRNYPLVISALFGTVMVGAVAYALLVNSAGDIPDTKLESAETGPVITPRQIAANPADSINRVQPPEKPSHATTGTPVVPATPAIDGKLRFDQFPQELRELMLSVYWEIGYGNFDHAAHVARDALDLAADFPNARIELHYLRGWCYEKIQYTDQAIAEYNSALGLYPGHRRAYTAMRRISPEFALANEELPPIKGLLSKPIKPEP